MKSAKHRAVLACLGLFLAFPLLVSAQGPARNAASHSAEKAPKKSAAARSKAASGAKNTARTSTRKSAATTARKSDPGCVTRRVKTSKGWQSQRVCPSGGRAEKTVARVEPALRSPIAANALNRESNAAGSEVKVRSAPDRAYAVDGATFFYQGRKYRIDGLAITDSSDMAKQRLQRALESGSLAVDQVRTDDAGTALANVRVNGRNIADDLH